MFSYTGSGGTGTVFSHAGSGGTGTVFSHAGSGGGGGGGQGLCAAIQVVGDRDCVQPYR